MPLLIPPSDGDPILGDVINSMDEANLLQETGRQAALDLEDATKVVSSLSLALGIVFLVTTAALYAYYYSTTFDIGNRRKRSLVPIKDNVETLEHLESSPAFLQIVEGIEASFVRWGVTDKECKKRLICEAFLPKTKLTPEARKEFGSFYDFMSYSMHEDNLSHKGPQMKSTMAQDYISASHSGMTENSCKTHYKECLFSDQIISLSPSHN